MYIYKKSYPFLLRFSLVLILINILLFITLVQNKILIIFPVVSIILFGIISLFFRIPSRKPLINKNFITAPADGEIISIEKTFEDEYLKKECTVISIFMSVFNVHQNTFPVSGKIIYFKYHPGKNLVAYHPKSSRKNEHTSVVIETEEGLKLKICQIAGLIARRIVCNVIEGNKAKQGDELGFIFFGSRVDIYLPFIAKINVKPGDRVKAKKDVIAEIISS